jgi:hypothetical protein
MSHPFVAMLRFGERQARVGAVTIGETSARHAVDVVVGETVRDWRRRERRRRCTCRRPSGRRRLELTTMLFDVGESYTRTCLRAVAANRARQRHAASCNCAAVDDEIDDQFHCASARARR